VRPTSLCKSRSAGSSARDAGELDEHVADVAPISWAPTIVRNRARRVDYGGGLERKRFLLSLEAATVQRREAAVG